MGGERHRANTLLRCREARSFFLHPLEEERKLDSRRLQLQRGTDPAQLGWEGRVWAPLLRCLGRERWALGREGVEPRGEEQNPEASGKVGRGRSAEPEPGRAASRALAVWAERSLSSLRGSLPSERNQRERPALPETGITNSSLNSELPGCPRCPCRPTSAGLDLQFVSRLHHGSFGEEDLGVDLPGGEAGVRPLPPHHLLGCGAGSLGGRLPAKTEAAAGPATGHDRRPARPRGTAGTPG